MATVRAGTGLRPGAAARPGVVAAVARRGSRSARAAEGRGRSARGAGPTRLCSGVRGAARRGGEASAAAVAERGECPLAAPFHCAHPSAVRLRGRGARRRPGEVTTAWTRRLRWGPGRRMRGSAATRVWEAVLGPGRWRTRSLRTCPREVGAWGRSPESRCQAVCVCVCLERVQCKAHSLVSLKN